MKEYLPVLEGCPLFEGIEPASIEAMLKCLDAQVLPYEKGRALLAAGDPARYLGVVLEGAVQIDRVDYFGNRSIIGKVGPGGIFGEAFACAGTAALPVDVTGTTSGAALLLDAGRVTRTCTNACPFHNRAVFNLLKIMALKNLSFIRKMEITSQRTTRDKLLTFLAQQAQDAEGASFDIAFDRQELADYLEVERSGLSAAISRLRREGVVESRRSHFRLLCSGKANENRRP